jgi:S1-C subfamily serine protease
MRLYSKTSKFFTAIIILFAFSACSKINVFEKYHKSVVMIYNESLNRLKVNNETIYFTYDKENNRILQWTEDEQQAREHPLADFGTGFFCDADGKIATNKHVVYDWFNKDEVSVRQIVRSWMQQKSLESGMLRDSASSNLNAWNGYYYGGRATTQEDIDKASLQLKYWKDSVSKYDANEKYWEGMLSALPEAKFDVETIFLGYAMDGSYAAKTADFKECQVLQVSDNDDIDLAIIQPTDKKIPAEVTGYLNVNNIDEKYELKVGDPVSLIGYNRGPEMAASKQGLLVQQNAGTISQQSNGNRILYSIPILPGSSGSPVFDKDGNLVAINFASAVNTQSFNYGILAKHLKALAKKIQ